MCTFDAPISRCEAMRCMVITDLTQRQCAREHDCPPRQRCPLRGVFTGREFTAKAPRASGRRQVAGP